MRAEGVVVLRAVSRRSLRASSLRAVVRGIAVVEWRWKYMGKEGSVGKPGGGAEYSSGRER